MVKKLTRRRRRRIRRGRKSLDIDLLLQ